MWKGDVITRYDVMLLGQRVHCSDRKAGDKVTSYCTDVNTIGFPCRVQTNGQPRSFILTQLPLPDTVVDLWRLVAGSDVSMIVSLGDETDEFEVIKTKSVKDKG